MDSGKDEEINKILAEDPERIKPTDALARKNLPFDEEIAPRYYSAAFDSPPESGSECDQMDRTERQLTREQLIRIFDPSCVDSNESVVAYGNVSSMQVLSDAMGYSARTTKALVFSGEADFIHAIAKKGIEAPSSVPPHLRSNTLLVTTVSSAQAFGETQKTKQRNERQKRIKGWFKTDPTSGSNIK